jgi:GGDEF domain-containing protein
MNETMLAAIAGGFLAVVVLGRGRVFGNGRQGPESILLSTYRQCLSAYNRELNRARRADRPLSVVVFALDHDALKRTTIESGEPSRTRVVYLMVGTFLREMLREHDLVAYDPATDCYVLLLVDSDRAEAARMITRIREQVRVRTTLPLQAGLSQLPDDGLTITELVRQAGEQCASRGQRPDIGSVERFPGASPLQQRNDGTSSVPNRS